MRSPSTLFLSVSRQIPSGSRRQCVNTLASRFPQNARCSSSTSNLNSVTPHTTPVDPTPSSSRSSGSAAVSSESNNTTSSGLNDSIIEMLKQQRREERQNPGRNEYKIGAFTKAINLLSSLDYPVRTASQAIVLKGVGLGITRRIVNFLDERGQYGVGVSEANREEDEKMKVQLALEGVPGIGQAKARNLVEAGCKTVEDLQKPEFQRMLSSSQRIAALYEGHLRQSVSREESEAVLSFLQRNLPNNYSIELVGSYRREFPTSPSIEVLLHHPDHVHVPFPPVPPPSPTKYANTSPRTFFPGSLPVKSRESNKFYQDMVKGMETRGLIASTKTVGERRWQGIVRIPNENEERWHRVNGIRTQEGTYRMMMVHLAPQKSIGSALLALTGDSDFLRHLRLRAWRVGMYLDEYGLWRWNSRNGNSGEPDVPVAPEASDDRATLEEEEDTVERGHWKLMRTHTEEEILVELGLDWVPPERRNLAYLSDKSKSKK
ncbi:Nucleotidyltransferase [Pluteus cervinus]|uniref:Nucleotidyltransferase n=1 Tax=Pluteus cervinus TaxID=181527 RepID=A0ACD3AZ41_9AGAR|nr:Nucleotidyltransferase [Pluteus cervinus]